MFKNILLGALLGVAAALGYLYETEKSDHESTAIDAAKYERMYEHADSLRIDRDIKLDSAESYIVDLEHNLVKSQNEKIKIQIELETLQAGVDTISVDSLAEYIISNFAGDNYFIHKVNDSTYLSLQDLTCRDIVSRDLEFKAITKLFKQVSYESAIKDTMILEYKESLKTAIDYGDDIRLKYDEAIMNMLDKDIRIQEIEGELDRTKKIAWGSVIINGVLTVIIILL